MPLQMTGLKPAGRGSGAAGRGHRSKTQAGAGSTSERLCCCATGHSAGWLPSWVASGWDPGRTSNDPQRKVVPAQEGRAPTLLRLTGDAHSPERPPYHGRGTMGSSSMQ